MGIPGSEKLNQAGFPTASGFRPKSGVFSLSKDSVPLLSIAGATLLLHLLTAHRYGFNRDELAILEDARHLAWGYVSYPPVTPFLGRVALTLFGTSLVGFRFFSALVQAVAVYLTGLMARDIGGGLKAQVVAALASVPFSLGVGALMQYMSFDYFAWVLTAYFVVRLCSTDNPRYFAGIGASIGFGILTKYTILFFAAGVLAAVVFTRLRTHLRSPWPWIGLTISFVFALPNFVWQMQQNFVTYDFLLFIHNRDIQTGLTQSFMPDQIEMTLLALPVWVAGLYFCVGIPQEYRFRPLAWMYLVPLFLFVVAKGRGYYLTPAYPMLYAAGAVWGTQLLARLSSRAAKLFNSSVIAALCLSILGAIAVGLPVAPIGSKWFYLASRINITLRDEIGWQDQVYTLAQVRDTIPPQDRAKLGILVENYGEVGAVNLYGPRLGLPTAISGVNSSWERGPGTPPPQILIVVGFTEEFVDANFTGCRLTAETTNSYGVENEESTERPDIYVCGPPRAGWEQFWRRFRYFA